MLEHETTVTTEGLLAAVRGLKDEGCRFITCSGVQAAEGIEVIYHFDLSYQLRHLRLSLPAGGTVPSISSVYPGAYLAENELQDFFGVTVSDLPVDFHGRLFLDEDAPISPMLRVIKRDGEEAGSDHA